MLTCTAGDIFEYRSANRVDIHETRRKAEGVARVLGMMDYDAIAPGEKDLAFGREFLNEMVEEHGLRLVCTNAVDRKSGELIFDPWLVREVDGVRVGFLGVVSPERHIVAQVESELHAKSIEIRDPTESINAVLEEVRAASDIVVLLSHTGIESAEFLAEDLGVDVVIVGHYPAILNAPKPIGDTILGMAGAKSDRFGTLDLTLDADGKVVAHHGDAIRLLLKGPDVAEITAIAKEAEQREKDLRRERQLASQRERENQQRAAVTDEIHDRGGVYGAESCKSCHEPTYDAWMQTPHATAFATLAEADAWDNPDCIGCHVTGVAEKDYVSDVNIPPDVWNVQCEECHGSGLSHARDGSYTTGGETVCLKCHDTDNSPDFDFELYASYGVH